MKTTRLVLFLVSIAATVSLPAQTPNQPFYPMPQSLDADSLNGFDEKAATASAISEQFTGPELRVRMYQLKRQYINDKYNIKPSPFIKPFDPGLAAKVLTAACVNEDFEASPAGPITGTTLISGWTIVAGSNMPPNNSCNLLGCCPGQPSESEIITTTGGNGYIDPMIGSIYPIYSVFGSTPGSTLASASNTQIPGGMFGNTFLRLNSALNNYSIERLSKTFQVTTSNCLFRFAFINVISTGHSCCDASSFMVRLIDNNSNTVIANSSYSVSGLSAACNNTSWVTYYDAFTFNPSTVNSTLIFNPWVFNFLNLSPYIGQNVTVEVSAIDCTAGGHYSYTYFDSQCSALGVEVNGMTSNTLSCVDNATLTAPANMPNYHWVGPGSFTSAAQTITTATSGNYTLTMDQIAPLPSAIVVVPLNIAAPDVQVTSASGTICEGQSVNLNASGASSYTWSTGATGSNLFISPAVTTNYTVVGTSPEGCQASAVITQVVESCTGINTSLQNQKGAGLFPNPNKGNFVLNVYEKGTKCEFLVNDVLGKEVYRQNVQSGENNIRIQGLATGVYYFSVNRGEHQIALGKFTVE